MASTYSPSLRLELIGDGDQSGIWGQTTNNNLGALIEQAISGVMTITMVDANYTMSNFNGVVDEARNQVLVVAGALTATRNLIAPLVEKTYLVKNSTTGGQAIQIIGSSGLGVTIPNGITTYVYCDGINFYNALSGSVGNFTVNGNLAVTGTTSLTGALSASTATFSGAISSVNPTFTGTPTAVTAAPGTNTTQIATTAFVQNVAGGLGTMSTQNANAVAITGGAINGVSGSNPSMSVGTATSATTAVTATTATTATSANQFQGKTKLGLGITGEAWNNVTGSRSFNTPYTNSYSYPIMVSANTNNSGPSPGVEVVVGGVRAALWYWQFNGAGAKGGGTAIVPAGATYQLNSINGAGVEYWAELY